MASAAFRRGDSIWVAIADEETSADFEQVAIIANQCVWDGGTRGYALPIVHSMIAAGSWNDAILSLHRDSLLTDAADARAIAILYLNHLTSARLGATAHPDSSGRLSFRTDDGRPISSSPMTTAAYRADDGWAVNGHVTERRPGYTFTSRFAPTGAVPEFDLELLRK